MTQKAAKGQERPTTSAAKLPEYTPAGFFALRSPLLPFEELEAFGLGLTAAAAVESGDPKRLAAAVAADRELVRERLRAAIARPEVAEAVFLASPSLADGLAAWQADPDSKKGRRAELALVRYFLRMTARATPFGLFSGCSVGTLGAATRLRLAPREQYGRHTRLDMDYLFALAEDLGKDPTLRGELSYRPNSSLYRAAGRWRYAEARLDNKVRSHHLVALDATPYLDATLERAAAGARAADLAAALVADDPEIAPEEAAEFIGELIDCQVLVSDLSPPVSGPEAIHDLVAQLAAAESETARAAAAELDRARRDLEDLDAGGLGAAPDRYRALAKSFEELPTKVELSRFFQADMVKPGDGLMLGPEVLAEMRRGIEILYGLSSRMRHESLDRFRQDFSDRYGEGRWVPLIEALDEEVGVGFGRSDSAGAEASPLLRGVVLAATPAEPTTPWGTAQAFLLRKLEEARARGEQAIDLTAADLEQLAGSDPLPMPEAIHAMGAIAASSEEDVTEGRFRLFWRGAAGPSGARLLGRFCHADPLVCQGVSEHLAAEEALRPDAVFAEIVHLPQGRIGNILSRPVLRQYEIPFLGRSGAPAERQLPITDLSVTVLGGRIALRSERLGREVVPRLTSAHNFVFGSLGVYRFLCSLQTQGTTGGVDWSWGPLGSAVFLPRVTAGRLVLARARWRMNEEEIKALTGSAGATGATGATAATGPAAPAKASGAAKAGGTATASGSVKANGAERFAAVARWRAECRLPRWVALADGDNELVVDLENVLAVDTWLDVLEQRKEALLYEMFPGPDDLCARGPEGRFLHELVVPFVRAGEPAARPAAGRGLAAAETSERPARRSFAPGSEWLYAKLYTGTSTADGLLREIVTPVVRQAMAEGLADGWFFIRYGDPQWHLRVRFHGEAARLQLGVLPLLAAATEEQLDSGKLWRFQLDTYEREVERYGGPEGTALAERLFEADSEAVLAILEMLEGDEGADARWRLALVGVDRLLGDLGLDAAGKTAVLGRMRESFGREFGGGKGLRVQLDQKFRAERKSLELLLDPVQAAESPLAPGIEPLERRSERNAPIVAELRRLEAAGRLTVPLAELAPSYVHMHVNRMIRSAARAHELLLYDLLALLLESQAARARKSAPREAAPLRVEGAAS